MVQSLEQLAETVRHLLQLSACRDVELDRGDVQPAGEERGIGLGDRDDVADEGFRAVAQVLGVAQAATIRPDTVGPGPVPTLERP